MGFGTIFYSWKNLNSTVTNSSFHAGVAVGVSQTKHAPMHTSKSIQEPLAHCSMTYNLWWTNSNLTCCLWPIVCELGCSMSFQFCVSWHKSHKRGRISCFPQSGRVKWDFTSPHGNDSPCQTLALKTARPSRLTDRDDTYMSMHRPSVHLFRNRACWESYMCTHKHTHLSLSRLDIFLRHTHSFGLQSEWSQTFQWKRHISPDRPHELQ